jgi:hypothetical protein
VSASRNLWLTDRDRQMLAFMAEHRLVLEEQVAVLIGRRTEAIAPRLRALAAKGYLTRTPGFDAARCCAIRPRGLAAIGSRLPTPRENLGMYRHDIGAAWLWLAAQRGAFGTLAEVIGERLIRSHDMAAPDDPYAIRLGGYHGDGRERRHYPDLLLIDRQGRRLALELELSLKEKARREEIIAGYGTDRGLAGVLYLVEDTRHGRLIGRAMLDAAAQFGLSDRLGVRAVPPLEPGSRGAGAGWLERTRAPTALGASR